MRWWEGEGKTHGYAFVNVSCKSFLKVQQCYLELPVQNMLIWIRTHDGSVVTKRNTWSSDIQFGISLMKTLGPIA